MERIYFDYAASTPVASEVFEAMKPYFSKRYGNPGSLHSFGQEAMAAVDQARETIAKAVGADFREVVFTGSATEANNLALRGTVRSFWWNFFKKNGGKKETEILPHIITTAIEHESILETIKDIEQRGVARVTVLPVGREGFVDLGKLKDSLTEETVLVSVMYANNEIGTVQPVKGISKLIENWKLKIGNSASTYPLFHVDAVQAFQFLDCDVKKLGVDLMTVSAHKIYGPKGVGVLIRPIGPISPIITGGGQEFGLRSGTENVAAIVGFARAVELVAEVKEKESKRIKGLEDYFWEELKKIYSKTELNGGGLKLPNILNVYFPGQPAEELLIKLDQAGIAVSSGSACSVRSAKPSHVLEAIGLESGRIKSSIRFSFGRPTTKAEIDKALKQMKNLLR